MLGSNWQPLYSGKLQIQLCDNGKKFPPRLSLWICSVCMVYSLECIHSDEKDVLLVLFPQSIIEK